MPPSGGFPLFRKKRPKTGKTQQKEPEMKNRFTLPIFSLVFLIGAVLVSPVSAELKKLDDAELARTNASVTGIAVKDKIAGAKRGTVRPETEHAILSPDKGTTLLFTSGNKAMEGISLNLNISGQETWQFNFGSYNTNYYGGITGVRTR